MIRPAITNRTAWQDRWSKPSIEQLLEPLRFHHRRCFGVLLERVQGLEDVEPTIVWYGPSWRWTIHCALPEAPAPRPPRGGDKVPDPSELNPQALCYLVPNIDHPLVCVPLSAEMIDQLPKRRLSKFIRDGIAAAKCAVEIRWAVWSPTTESEVGLLLDLLRRKHEFELAPAAA